jgi:hypothetical protein
MAAGACMLLLAACGSTTATTPTPVGPASAQITLRGDSSMAGPMTIIGITCLIPTLDGMTISLIGLPNGQPANGMHAYVDIRAGTIAMTIGSGGGPTLVEREFSGSGVSGFNAAGVRLSGAVDEITGSQLNKGTVGNVTAVQGSVSCGNQTNGTSNITVTGTSADGPISVTTSHFRVACSTGSSGKFVNIRGVITINGVRATVIVSIGATTVSFDDAPEHGPIHFYFRQGQVGTTVGSTGGQVDSDAPEEVKPGANPYAVHIKGSATCGSSGSY